MPKKQAGLPDLKTRFGWLPGGNKVDPQIYTQLDPTAKKPLPDFPTQDVQAPQSDSPVLFKPPVVTPTPGGGGGGGGGPIITPPPPPPPPPVEPGHRPTDGQEHRPPPGRPPTLPRPVPPVATPSDPNKDTSNVTYPPNSPPPPGIPPEATPSPTSTELTTTLFNPYPQPEPVPSPFPPPIPPVATPSPVDTTITGTDSSFLPYEGDNNGPPQGPPTGGGWTYPWEPPVPSSPSGGDDEPTLSTDENIDYGQGPVSTDDVPTVDDNEEETGSGGVAGDDSDDGLGGEEDNYNFASGGIIMKPRIGRVGERGPEAIMKLGPRMPGGWEVPMRPGKLPYPRSMNYKRRSEVV